MTRFDYHVHTTYSDGGDLGEMVRAAERVGLDGIGFADHCNVTDPDIASHPAYRLHETYEKRRTEIEACRVDVDLTVFDAVELDYDPNGHDELKRFLTQAGFDYSIGSVHTVDGINVISGSAVGAMSDARKRRFVDQYFETLVELIESELFDIVAHLDVLERHRHLRGLPNASHYRAVAAAIADSRTVPEVNYGSVTSALGATHPCDAFLDILRARDIRFVFGSDAHSPEQLRARHRYRDRPSDDQVPNFVERDFDGESGAHYERESS